AIEIDRHLAPVLRSVVAGTGVKVIEADARALDWPAVLGDHSWAMVANLPYNVATPLVADLLDEVPAIFRMLVMVQREVAERLAARVGDEGYGAVSVKVAYWATAKLAGNVPRSVFLPRPNVDSALVAIERRAAPATDAPRARLFELVRVALRHRRKMLPRSLDGAVDAAAFECAGVRPDARPEELDVTAWGRLAACSS